MVTFSMNLYQLKNNHYKAMLFDMDGTLVNSLISAEWIWKEWARDHGLDVEKFIPTIHGKRSVETIAALNLSGVDPEVEAMKITNKEIEHVEGIVEIPGAKNFLEKIPKHQWAIVTSAPRALAIARIKAAQLPMPEILITAEDVSIGKPNPACFIMAAKNLGVDIKECLIFEDAIAGIDAAHASGAQVVVVTCTHQKEYSGADPHIKNYLNFVEELLGKLIF